jgi:hypothetical protein
LGPALTTSAAAGVEIPAKAAKITARIEISPFCEARSAATIQRSWIAALRSQ